jgi:uncharacterized membrane protein YeiH
MRVIIHILDLIGVFAFAFFGAHAGIEQRFSFLGILTCAFLPALGGGTIREMLLSHTPIYFSNYAYGIAVVGAALFALSTQHKAVVRQYMYVLDALGMTIFAYLGAHAALRADLGLTGSIAFAVLTACGGGVLCDLVTRQVPHVFRHHWYAMPPLLLGAIFWLMGGLPVPMHERWFLIGSIFALQLGITYQVFQRPFTRRLQLFWKQSQLADS